MHSTLGILRGLTDLPTDTNGWLALILSALPIWLVFFALEQWTKEQQSLQADRSQTDRVNRQAQHDSWTALARRFPSMRQH
jgi:hypothetical protein